MSQTCKSRKPFTIKVAAHSNTIQTREGIAPFVLLTPRVLEVPQPKRAGAPAWRSSRTRAAKPHAFGCARFRTPQCFDRGHVCGCRARSWTEHQNYLRRRAQEQVFARNYR